MPHRMKQDRSGAAVIAAAACLVATALLIAAGGCAPPRGRPPAPYYAAAPANVRDVDVSSLEGKRIVIDAGHGGVFRGALGWGGLAEADVNLGVALYLWGLLRDAGADALLTRSSDTDFVGGTASELRQDLSKRSEIAASFKPHLFVSLHHNADLARSKEKNQVETYFRMLDDGPSKDVAVLVHRSLQERLQIPQGTMLAGNYFVLRTAPCAAVLGEPSYITNPWVEDKLRLAEKQLLEAQAYFLAIVDYFSRGVPAIAALAPRDTAVAEARPWLAATVQLDRGAVDPLSVTCELDGNPISGSYEPSTGRLMARPEDPLAGGRHEFCFSFRNDAGNSSGEACASFDADLPAARVSLEAQPAAVPPLGCVLATAEVRDENSNPVRDGTPVVFSSSSGAFARETVATVSGIASTFLFGDGRAETTVLRVRSEELADSVSLVPSGQAATCLSVQDARTGNALAGAQIFSGDSAIATATPQGLAVVTVSPEGLIVVRTGYVPSLVAQEAGATGPSRAVRMRPVALGVLQGARLTVDLGETEADDSDASRRGRAGPDAARAAASALSETVAGELAGLLRGAGAQVVFERPGTPDADKVSASERIGAQRYVRIEPAPDGRWSFLHYPDSKSGAKLATELSNWWSKIAAEGKAGHGKANVFEDAHYVLRQTGCPAVVVRVAQVAAPLERTAALRTAYAFFLAILEDMGLDSSLLIESSVKAGGGFEGEAADMVLDGFIRIPLSADGSARFFCEEGTHLVTVESGSRRTAPHFIVVRPAQQMDERAR